MRPTRYGALSAALLATLAVTACGNDGPPQRLAAEPPSASASPAPDASQSPSVTPSPTAPSPGATRSATATPSTPSSPSPRSTRSATSTPSATADPTEDLGPAKTDLSDRVLLPGSDQQERGVRRWQDLGECILGTPGAAVAMATTRTGDGKFERQVPVQQVAVFATVKDAVAEAGRLETQLAGCAGGAYATEPVAVGAQGQGLSFGYSPYQDGFAFGNYLVTTRRGNAVTLLTSVGGEGSPAGAKQTETRRAQGAWTRLCLYERTDGC